MSVLVRQLDEPSLEFGDGTDRRVKEGLTAHGPYSLRLGPRHPKQVRVGLVGPAGPLQKARAFLDLMQESFGLGNAQRPLDFNAISQIGDDRLLQVAACQRRP